MQFRNRQCTICTAFLQLFRVLSAAQNWSNVRHVPTKLRRYTVRANSKVARNPFSPSRGNIPVNTRCDPLSFPVNCIKRAQCPISSLCSRSKEATKSMICPNQLPLLSGCIHSSSSRRRPLIPLVGLPEKSTLKCGSQKKKGMREREGKRMGCGGLTSRVGICQRLVKLSVVESSFLSWLLLKVLIKFC